MSKFKCLTVFASLTYLLSGTLSAADKSEHMVTYGSHEHHSHHSHEHHSHHSHEHHSHHSHEHHSQQSM